MNIQQNVELSTKTSWLVGGVADFYLQVQNDHELTDGLRWAQEKQIPWTVLSGGTNVLISDRGIRGLVLQMSSLNRHVVTEQGDRLTIVAEAGVAKSELLKIFLKNQLPPALFLAGLPGDVGGGIVMNAGVREKFRPQEFCEIVDWIEVIKTPKLETVRIQKSDLQWTYRHCKGWQPGVILRAQISWPMNEKKNDIASQVRAANLSRLERQPLSQPSCGSVFINPPGTSAGQLIESCGLKGFQIGQAQVSPKHANFIVNLGGAKALDIWAVIRHVQKVVSEKMGVALHTEVLRLGEW